MQSGLRSRLALFRKEERKPLPRTANVFRWVKCAKCADISSCFCAGHAKLQTIRIPAYRVNGFGAVTARTPGRQGSRRRHRRLTGRYRAGANGRRTELARINETSSFTTRQHGKTQRMATPVVAGPAVFRPARMLVVGANEDESSPLVHADDSGAPSQQRQCRNVSYPTTDSGPKVGVAFTDPPPPHALSKSDNWNMLKAGCS